MLELTILPWWAGVYLLLYFGLTFADAMIDARERPVALVGDFLSFVFACVFVVAYFDPAFAQSLRLFFIPMVLFGLSWEFVQSVKAADRAEAEMKTEMMVSDKERSALLNIGVGLGALVVLPAYMMGLKLCGDLIMEMI